MALANYTYRLKALTGDSTPHDEKGGADLSGGTISLVDMGAGDYAWQFVGKASAVGPTKVIASTTPGGAVTIALRIAIASYDVSDYAYVAGYGTDNNPSVGLIYGQAGAGDVRARWVDSSADTTGVRTVSTAVKTVVIRATIGNAAVDKVHMWFGGVTGAGDAADNISPGDNYTNGSSLDTVFLGSAGSTIKVSDFVVWGEELSDADCHALAETGIRATLDVSASIAPLAGPFGRLFSGKLW